MLVSVIGDLYDFSMAPIVAPLMDLLIPRVARYVASPIGVPINVPYTVVYPLCRARAPLSIAPLVTVPSRVKVYPPRGDGV